LLQKPSSGGKLTEFHVVADDSLVDSFNEEEIPWAIILDEVHSTELSNVQEHVVAVTDWTPPAPVILALSFLLALAVFFSAD